MSHIHIDVENLNFSYESGTPVLSDLSFHASEHDSVGIIGANGAGKSTFLKLLVGLNLKFTGSIRIEEMPLEKSTLVHIREKIGYVFQDSDSQLFMTTVGEDVAFAPRNYGLPEEEVERRVQAALAKAELETRAEELRRTVTKKSLFRPGRLLRAFPEAVHRDYQDIIEVFLSFFPDQSDAVSKNPGENQQTDLQPQPQDNVLQNDGQHQLPQDPAKRTLLKRFLHVFHLLM